MAELTITVGAVEAQVDCCPRLCDKLLAIPDPAMQRDQAVRLRMCDGLKHFFDVDTMTYPAGLTHRLVLRLRKRGHQVNIVGEPPVQFPPTEADYLSGVDLRDYQVEAVDLGLLHRRGLFWMATNSGKSAVIAALAGRLVREARRAVLVVVPNAYLLHQTSKDIRKFLGPDVAVGIAGDGKRDLKADVLVGTYQTLMSGAAHPGARPDDPLLHDWLKKAGAVLVDEVHHASSPTYHRILRNCGAARFRFGFTGSLDKSDKREAGARKEGSEAAARMHRWKVESYLGPLLYRVDNEFLIQRGYSAKPRFYVIRDRNAFGATVKTPRVPPGLRGPGNDPYRHVFTYGCIKDGRWHKTLAAVVQHLLDSGRPPFVFTHSVKLLDALGEVLTRRGVPHRILYGDHATEERIAVVKEFEADGGFAVLASSIFDEGASIPAIRSVVFIGARKSPIELLQRLGRGVRRKDGDNTVIVVDFDPVHSTLMHDHFEARLASYRSEGFKVKYVDDVQQISSIV